MSVLTTMLVVTVGTRKTTAIEGRNVRAFQAAQAGLDRARVYASAAVDTAPATVTTGASLAQWLTQQVPAGLSGTFLDSSYTVTITVNTTAGAPNGTLLLTSTGRGPSGSSTAVLQQRAVASISQYNAPFKTPGGLIASGNVQLRGNDPIDGYELPGLPATTTAFTCTTGAGNGNKKNCNGSGSNYVLNGNFSSFAAGDYVDINGSLFKVSSPSSSSMTVTGIGNTSPFPQGSVTKVDPVLESNYAAKTSSNTLTMRASAGQAKGFLLDYNARMAAWGALGVPPGTLKTLGPAESQWAGYLRAVDRSGAATDPFLETTTDGASTVTVAQNPALSQYSVLQRIIPSVVTSTGSNAVVSNGNNAVPLTGQAREAFDASTLFGKTFSLPDPTNPNQRLPMTKQQYYDQATKISFDDLAASPSYYCGKVVWVGNTPGVTTPVNTARSVSLDCPPSNPATIVVNNEGATFDIGTETNFNGLLYVIGKDLAKQGNGCINGSVVIESSSPGMVADLRGTACPGGAQHDGYIKYDPTVLNTLANYNVTPQRNFDMTPASWREVKLP